MIGEQSAFEEWAKARGFVMDQHPLHYIFLDDRTNAARDGWRAGVSYGLKISTPPDATRQLGGSPEDLRNFICAVFEMHGMDGLTKVTDYVMKHRGINAFTGKPLT